MAHLHARGLGATRETAMGEPYAPAPLIRLLGCMELTVHLATYSGHDATSKLQTLTSQCHYALTFHEECRASMHAHDDWHIFEDARATLDYVLIGEVECPLAESVVEPTHVADLPPAAAPAAKRRVTQSVCPECLHRFSNLAKHMGWCCPNLKRKPGNPQGWQINGKWSAGQRS